MNIYLIWYQVRWPGRGPRPTWPVEFFSTVSDCSMGAIRNLEDTLPRSPDIERSAKTWLHVRSIVKC